ncbi:MAG TPA: phosphohydrolase, partial [Lachnospiraceae bacterium]|nr:phosphohydrolase [Lachnospiraceae bacterium]
RRENDAEHSWHICMYALILEEYAPKGCDILQSIKIMLVHDLVEIYAGDTYLYDEKGYLSKKQRETQAADKLFGLLDDEQAKYIRSLWDEFEENKTPSSNFANTLDRLQPIMLNYLSKGEKWLVNKVTKKDVLSRWESTAKNADKKIDTFLRNLLDECVQNGYLLP